jgi:hypothetical protein
MLTGVALTRRLVDRLVLAGLMPSAQPSVPDPGFAPLFSGTAGTFNTWQVAGQGNFSLLSGEIVAEPGSDLGLFYLATQSFADFTLKLEFKLGRIDDNSGVLIRFRNPRLPVPDRGLPGVSHPYNNQAFVAVDTGFEVQIDELARGNPDGLDEHRTGAIYGMPIGRNPGQQDYQRGPALVPGQWNTYEIEVRGNTYTVRLNGQQTTKFNNIDPFRGKSPASDPDSGYIGVQSHTGRVTFRNIQIMAQSPTLAIRPPAISGVKAIHGVEMPGETAEEGPLGAEEKKKPVQKTA